MRALVTKRNKTKKVFGVLSLAMLFCAGIAMPTFAQSQGDIPEPPADTRLIDDTLAFGTGDASYWAKVGKQYAEQGQYDKSKDAYFKAAELARAKGLGDDVATWEMYAYRYQTLLSLFYHRKTEAENVSKWYSGAKYEPLYGAYLGAYIEQEESLKAIPDGARVHRDSRQFDQIMQKQHALFLTYSDYGTPFPKGWFAKCKAAGASAVWSLQPRRLEDVEDNQYLRTIAQALKDTQMPVFLRFGSEMNGAWTDWGGKPLLFKKKFQLVAQVMKKICPNVAMVWCPAAMPQHKIQEYYPGAESVDWVGINFYCTYFANNDNKNPDNNRSWRNPADKLEYIYQTYSKQHPIMVGETAIAYQHTCEGDKVRSDYACDKLAQLFTALPRRYPRIKAIVYFSFDSIRNGEGTRKLYNYSLLGNDTVQQRYKEMIQPGYFLTKVTSQRAFAPTEYSRFTETKPTLSGSVPISAYAKTVVDHPTVRFTVDGKEVQVFNNGGNYMFRLNTKTLSNGSHTLEATIAVNGKVFASQKAAFDVTN